MLSGNILRACIAIQIPEKESAKAVSDSFKFTGNAVSDDKLFAAVVISRNIVKSASAVPFFINFATMPIAAEKKMIYDDMNMHESAEFLIELTILNICLGLFFEYVFISLLLLNKIPIAIDEIIMDIYIIMPYFMLLYIPIPIPDITKAMDGLLENPINFSHSVLLISLLP